MWTTADLSSRKKLVQPGVVIHIYNLNIQEAEAGGVLDIEGQLGLHNEQPELQHEILFQNKMPTKAQTTHNNKTKQGRMSLICHKVVAIVLTVPL